MLSINYNVHHLDNGQNRTTTTTRRTSSSLHNCASSSISMTSIQPFQNIYPADTFLDDDDDDLTILFNRTKLEGFEDRISLYHNTCLRYDDVERAGSPVCALEFPKPIINRAMRCTTRVLDHRSGRVQETSIVMKYTILDDKKHNKDCPRTIRAYLVGRKISSTKSTTSSSSSTTSLRLCTVLRRRMTTYDGRLSNSTTAEWKTTDEQVVIKMSQIVSPTMRSSSNGGGYHQLEEITNKKGSTCYNRTATKVASNANRNNGLVKEAATLQYLGNYHPNIVGCQEVLQDDQWLYIILPYGIYGSLYSNIITNKEQQSIIHSPKTIVYSGPMDVDTKQRYRNNSSTGSIDYEYENKVRCWFRQILQSLSHLQKKGVCHLDICLENIVIVDDRRIAITDFSSSLRIPYNDESNPGVISDVSQGSQRRLIRIQPNCTNNERLSYLAPEIINGSTTGTTCTTNINNTGFDGFAADLWSAGVVLFICLVGSAPFKWAHRTDYHYTLINQGKLHQLINESNVTISSDACDLLQNMFWYNPANRLVLSDICSHPWVVGTNTNTNTNTNIVPDSSNSSPTSSNGTTGTYQQQQYQRKTTATTTLLSSMNSPLSSSQHSFGVRQSTSSSSITTTKRRPPLVPSLYPREILR